MVDWAGAEKGSGATAFFRSHPQPMIVYEPDTLRVLAVNAAAVTHYGYPEDEFTTLTLLDIRPPEEVERMLTARAGREPPYVLPDSFRHLRKDGTVFDAVLSVFAVRFRGAPARLVVVADVSGDRRAFASLLRAEEKFRALFENAYDAIALMQHGRFVECNSRTADIFRLPRERFLGRRPNELSPAYQPDGRSSRHASDEHMRLAMAGEEQHFSWVYLKADGTPFDSEVHLSRLEVGGEVFLKVQVRDVSEQNRQLDELRELRQAVEQGSSTVLLTDAEGHIRYANRRFSEVTGFDKDEVVGWHASVLAAPDSDNTDLREIADVIRRDGVWRGEFVNRTRDGGRVWERAQITAVTDENGHVLQYLKVADDITERRVMSAQLEYLSTHDALTDLLNRVGFEDRLVAALAERRVDGRRSAVLVLDLQGFQLLKDGLGAEAGDELLRLAARRLTVALGGEGAVARVTRDEFAIVTGPLARAVDAAEVAARLLGALEEPVEVEGREASLRPRLGIAVYPDHAERPADLLKNASLALARARSQGGAAFAFFTPAMDVRARERFALEGELRAALSSDQLVLHFQPMVGLGRDHTIGVEALARWQHPVRGMLGPDAFIPLAEETGMIRELGLQVLRKACTQFRRWLDDGVPVDRVAVNLSPVQLRSTALVDGVREVLKACGVPPQRFEFEITETAAMLDARRGAEVLDELRTLGARVTLDDFGTGYASLAYLRDLPFDAIKLDRSFVRRLGTAASAADEGILAAVVSLGRSLGATVVAEGVETPEQLDALERIGCDAVQGFHLAPPIPASDLLARLQSLRIGVAR
jgi:diguanylate cyclase (GGDEF)-like protein/PAS domain S-box-containing protein